MLRNLFQHLSIDGILLFSTFGHETFQELHASVPTCERRKKYKNETSIGQRFYSKDQLLHICKIETGDVHVSETCYIESFTEVKEFLHSIRKVGAN